MHAADKPGGLAADAHVSIIMKRPIGIAVITIAAIVAIGISGLVIFGGMRGNVGGPRQAVDQRIGYLIDVVKDYRQEHGSYPYNIDPVGEWVEDMRKEKDPYNKSKVFTFEYYHNKNSFIILYEGPGGWEIWREDDFIIDEF